jgi:single-strand DNA-binding protein
LVEGRLRWRSWEGQDGQKRSKHDVLASTVQFLPRSNGAMTVEYEPGENGDEMPF